MWLAETLGEKETRWVPDVEPWGAGSAEETLDYSGTDEHAFEDALADLDNSTALDNAIAALHRAEQCLHDLSIATRTLLASPLRVSLGRAGLERVVPGSHPYIVFDPNTGGVWSAGARVARFRVGSVMGRLLYSIAVHGASWGRERLYSEVWEKTYRPPSSDAALRMAVSRLRNQLRGSGVGVERIGDGQYALADRPAVVCWREEAVIVDDKPSGSLAALTAPPPTIRTNLGPEPNPFVGRQDALAKLAARFSGDDRLVTVLGPPGTGKTRFIRHFGALQVEAGDSAWFCDLTNARTEDGVLSAVANALGVPLTGAGPDEDALANGPRGRSSRTAPADGLRGRPSRRPTRWGYSSRKPMRIPSRHLVGLHGSRGRPSRTVHPDPCGQPSRTALADGPHGRSTCCTRGAGRGE